MSAVAKPLSIEEERGYRLQAEAHEEMGKPCYANGYWTALDTLRLLATIEEQRARVAVLEEALRELVFAAMRAENNATAHAHAVLAGKEVSG